MSRGKDLKPRKKDLYGSGNSKRILNPGYREKFSNSIKESRANEMVIENDINEYSFEETQIELKKILPWTQGTNRKVYKNKRLYKSIKFHTSEFIPSSNKLSELINFILNDKNIKNVCEHCNEKFNYISYNIGYNRCGARLCPSQNKQNHYTKKLKELNNDEKQYKKWLNQRINTHSVEWFKLKYNENWSEKHEKYKKKMGEIAIKNLQRNNNAKSSKIANTLFKSLCESGFPGRCAENGGEICINMPSYSILNKNCIFLDFVLDKKIIEYDCDYYHNSDEDAKRDLYLKSLGYDVLRINHSEFSKPRNRDTIIIQCINFLNAN